MRERNGKWQIGKWQIADSGKHSKVFQDLVELAGKGDQAWVIDRSQSGAGAALCRRSPWRCRVIERVAQEIGEVAEIGSLHSAGFQAERQGIGIGRDGDGGDLQEFLL